MADLPFHPIANIFPLIEGVAFRDLVEDIRVHGLREPIVLFEGALLDGRNRARACHAAQVPARYKTYDGRDALAFSISANLHRRHLDVSQRALIAARISEKKTGRWQSRGPSQKLGGRVAKKLRPDRLKPPPEASDKVSCSDAARLMNVSGASVTQAHKVIKRGIPDLVAAVASGDLPVSSAAIIAAFDATQQQNILISGPKIVAVLAREDKASRRGRERGTSGVLPYDVFRIGDGRAIGNVRIGECERLAQLLLVTADVLRGVAGHFANPDHSARVRDVIAHPRLAEIIEAAWKRRRAIAPDAAESA